MNAVRLLTTEETATFLERGMLTYRTKENIQGTGAMIMDCGDLISLAFTIETLWKVLEGECIGGNERYRAAIIDKAQTEMQATLQATRLASLG